MVILLFFDIVLLIYFGLAYLFTYITEDRETAYFSEYKDGFEAALVGLFIILILPVLL